VYGLVAWWAAEGQEIDRARRALCLKGLEVSVREDPFASIIRCTADPGKADKRTRSKWSRIMRYVALYKGESEPLGQFIQRKRGINACAARFTRRMGRGALGGGRSFKIVSKLNERDLVGAVVAAGLRFPEGSQRRRANQSQFRPLRF
jgi:hypothetical protein